MVMKSGRKMGCGMIRGRAPCGRVFFAVFGTLLIFSLGLAACSGNQAEPSQNRVSSPETSADDDSANGPDYQACLEAFDYIGSQCGAQFFDANGGLMTQNDLMEACGRPKALCVTSCYSKSRDCADIKTCLKETCGL
jgi:hypothetical protein